MKLVFLFFVSLSALIWASDPIYTVPNAIANTQKSLSKMPETNLDVENQSVKTKLDSHSLTPVAFLNIGSKINEVDLLKALANKYLNPDFSFHKKSQNHYELFWNGVTIENAGVDFIQDKKFRSASISIPEKSKPFLFGKTRTEKLVLMGHVATEYRDEIKAKGALRSFPKETEIPTVLRVQLTPEKSKVGQLEKIKLESTNTFADQIHMATDGSFWYSEPFSNRITRYNHETKKFDFFPVGKGPDGLGIDRLGRIWFGEYFDQAIGMYDPKLNKYEQYKMKYPEPKPAIPFEDRDGIIWVSDHQANRLLRFDPSTKTTEDFELPSKGAWIVDITETEESDMVYVNECNTNKMARFIKSTKKFEEFSVASTKCPGFLQTDGKIVWIGQWGYKSVIKYDTISKSPTEYVFEGEAGVGPIALRSDGKLCVGSLSGSKIYLFDPETNKLLYHLGASNLKDGMTVAQDGSCFSSGTGWLSKASFE